MLKKFLIAAVVMIASPAIVSAQDIFWSFDSATNVTNTTGDVGTSGTAYIFSDQPFAFDDLDLNFTSSDSSVLLLTGGTEFNEPFSVIGGTAFNSSALTIDPSGTSGNLFSMNINQNGINPAVSALFNPAFEAGAGSGDGAVRLAEITYDIVGSGTATLDLALGAQGAILDPISVNLYPSFGTATLTTGVPEPSSMALLVLGSVGLVVRRKRPKAKCQC